MFDFLGRLCFSNAPFRGVERVFFDWRVLWPGGAALAVGLPLALLGTALEHGGLLIGGLVLTLPFLLWVALLAGVSLVLAIPRLAFLGLLLVAICFGLVGVTYRLGRWAARYDETANR